MAIGGSINLLKVGRFSNHVQESLLHFAYWIDAFAPADGTRGAQFCLRPEFERLLAKDPEEMISLLKLLVQLGRVFMSADPMIQRPQEDLCNQHGGARSAASLDVEFP